MSLVEKALKKLQESRSTVAPEPMALRVNSSANAVRPSLTADVGVERRIVPPTPSAKVEFRRDALRAAGLLPPEHQEREIADQFRQIKRPLVDNVIKRADAGRADAHLIMVASALAGEGKTFTSLNLALSMSLEKDIRVLLVDADMPKPHVSRLFGIAKEPGLVDALADESIDVESRIFGTDVPNLSVLGVGSRSEVVPELFASSRMERLVTKMTETDPGRVIIFDSSPLLLTQESRVLAQVAGQVVLVIRANETPQKAVLDAIGYLDSSKSIGLVLNQSDATQLDGYYYGYGSYGDSPEND